MQDRRQGVFRQTHDYLLWRSLLLLLFFFLTIAIFISVSLLSLLLEYLLKVLRVSGEVLCATEEFKLVYVEADKVWVAIFSTLSLTRTNRILLVIFLPLLRCVNHLIHY